MRPNWLLVNYYSYANFWGSVLQLAVTTNNGSTAEAHVAGSKTFNADLVVMIALTTPKASLLGLLRFLVLLWFLNAKIVFLTRPQWAAHLSSAIHFEVEIWMRHTCIRLWAVHKFCVASWLSHWSWLGMVWLSSLQLVIVSILSVTSIIARSIWSLFFGVSVA